MQTKTPYSGPTGRDHFEADAYMRLHEKRGRLLTDDEVASLVAWVDFYYEFSEAFSFKDIMESVLTIAVFTEIGLMPEAVRENYSSCAEALNKSYLDFFWGPLCEGISFQEWVFAVDQAGAWDDAELKKVAAVHQELFLDSNLDGVVYVDSEAYAEVIALA